MESKHVVDGKKRAGEAGLRRLRRLAWWGGLGLALVYAVLVLGVVPHWLGNLATTRTFHFPDKENQGLTPESFHLAYTPVSFRAVDGVELKGWWVKSPEDRGTVLLVHGLNRSRLEMVRKLPFLSRLGWNALLFDLRHHGESQGKVTSFGFFERLDVEAAADLAASRSRGPLVGWGISLGAATTVLAAAVDPRLQGVVCDSSYRSLRDTARHHIRLFRRFRWWMRAVPAWPVADLAVDWMGKIGKFDPDAIDIVAAARHLSARPALFVCNSGDRRMPPDIAFDLKAAAGERAEVLEVPGESHGGAYRDGRAAYEAAVTRLLRAVTAEAAADSVAGTGTDAGGAGPAPGSDS